MQPSEDSHMRQRAVNPCDQAETSQDTDLAALASPIEKNFSRNISQRVRTLVPCDYGFAINAGLSTLPALCYNRP